MSVNNKHNLQGHLSTMLFALQGAMSDEQQNWLISALAEVSKTVGDDKKLINRIVSYTAMVRRCLGETPVVLTLPVYEAGNSSTLRVTHWSMSDLARIVLVGSGLKDAVDDDFNMLQQLLRFSDNNEKKSIYMGLYWLLEDDALAEVLIDAQRTNAMDLFVAITLNNPIVRKYFDEPAFNQVVLKSLFQKIPIDRIIGLQERRNDELVRMCDDYLHERRLAGREIPSALWLVLSTETLTAETLDAWQAAVTSPEDEQRFYAISALQLCLARGEQLPASLNECLNSQGQIEKHTVIRGLVQDMQSQTN